MHTRVRSPARLVSRRLRILHDVSHALLFVHEHHNINHLDLKSPNVMISTSGKAKITGARAPHPAKRPVFATRRWSLVVCALFLFEKGRPVHAKNKIAGRIMPVKLEMPKSC